MSMHSPRLLVLSLIAITLTGCASSGNRSNEPRSSNAPGQEVVTKVVTQTASQPNVHSASATKTRASHDSFRMPNEVGKVLQAAQDDIQRVSGNPLFYTSSTDATGAGRMQVLDRNWKVCTQNIQAGTRVNQDSDISFGAVKLDEQCP